MDLPPGFRFHPTDEEIITHYLARKVRDEKLITVVIGEVDLNKYEPWDLREKAKIGEKEWFFFCQTKKYPSGIRTSRTTSAGYWKSTAKDKEIYVKKCKGGVTSSNGELLGWKKTLVFYLGRAPKGEKTNWVMHEYRLQSHLPKGEKNEWVVCKVFHKNIGIEPKRNSEELQSPTINGGQYSKLQHYSHDKPSMEDNIPSCSTTHMTRYLEEEEFKAASSLKAKSTAMTEEEEEFKAASSLKAKSTVEEEAAIFSSYFSNINSNLSIPISSYPTNVFNIGSYNQSPSNPIFLDYQTQEYQNPSVYKTAAAENEQYYKVEEFSSNNNSMVSTEVSSLPSNMQDLEYLWDFTDY